MCCSLSKTSLMLLAKVPSLLVSTKRTAAVLRSLVTVFSSCWLWWYFLFLAPLVNGVCWCSWGLGTLELFSLFFFFFLYQLVFPVSFFLILPCVLSCEVLNSLLLSFSARVIFLSHPLMPLRMSLVLYPLVRSFLLLLRYYSIFVNILNIKQYWSLL